MQTGQHHDVVVIGASMGGIQALKALAAQLPEGLPASVLVVQHTSSESPRLLGDILDREGPLPAAIAEDRTPLERGRIYVAPPDHHLLLTEDGIRLLFGPRENRSRPAVDPLFRTAAVSHRSRVIGVVLTGLLGDGASGLLAVRRCGGIAVVQAPEDAAYPDMPTRALAAVPDAHRVELAEMGAFLARLVAKPAPPPPPVPAALRLEARLTEQAMSNPNWHELPSHATDFTCPECHGAIHEIEGEPLRRYRCRVGHAFSVDTLMGAKTQQVEEALWLALQTLQERAQMLEGLAQEERLRGRTRSGYEDRGREARAVVEQLRELIGAVSVPHE